MENSQQAARVTPRLLTVEQASSYLNIPVRTLNDWRHKAKGPPFVRVNKVNARSGRIPNGNVIRYRPEDLEAWITEKVEVPR